jgi:hypothetical protein
MKLLDPCISVCEEFTDTILVDGKNSSILLNIESDWVDILTERLQCLRYKLIHKSAIGDTFTCVYIKES